MSRGDAVATVDGTVYRENGGDSSIEEVIARGVLNTRPRLAALHVCGPERAHTYGSALLAGTRLTLMR